MTRNRNLRSRRPENILGIPEKANKILNLILIAMIVIIFRIWHLGVIQHEDKMEESRKPQRKTIVEASKRGTIRDRFNIPLALNKISYRATILYSQLRQIPSVKWEKDASGKKVKKFKRKEYIYQLAQLLGEELNLDANRIEDLIHAKGSFYGQIPFVIKEDLTEKEYYRLKMLEKDWLGINVEKIPRRHYPKGRVASDVIGYMGAINRQEYDKIVQEIKILEEYIHGSDAEEETPLPAGIETIAQAKQRLQDLEDQAYTINDSVGKAGIEGNFESTLRGYHGKKSYYSDARGNFLRELPGSQNPAAGERILLTISAELQEYAEKLLIQNERIRETRLSKHLSQKTKQPWIKGGAIIAIEPNTGEVLTLASYPRIDPNDFVPTSNPEEIKKKISRIIRWFESETYVAEMWDQKRSLERERYDDGKEEYKEEFLPITWPNYLSIILKEGSPIYQSIQSVHNVENAVKIQNSVSKLMEVGGTSNPYWLLKVIYGDDGTVSQRNKIPSDKKNEIEANLQKNAEIVLENKKILSPYFDKLNLHYDKILLFDLCQVGVCNYLISEELLNEVGKQSLEDYRKASSAYASLQDALKLIIKDLFHEHDFSKWRTLNEKDFLKEKRNIEKLQHLYPKPYLDYFDKQEQEMFKSFWEKYQWDLLFTFLTAEPPSQKTADLNPYIDHLLIWHEELQNGAHSGVTWKTSFETLQNSIAGMKKPIAKEYLRSFRSFYQLNRPLLGSYRHLRKQDGKQLEKHLAAAFYPARGYGYGRSQAYRQAATQGSIFKLVTSYEALKQRYHKLEGQVITPDILNPLTITDQVFKRGNETCVAYHQDGKPIPVYYNGGRLLKSAKRSIGKIDLIKALESSSNPYFSLLAAENLSSPLDLARVSEDFSYGKKTGIELPSEIKGNMPQDLATNRTGLYAMANGQHTLVVTPLQTSVMLSSIANGGKVLKPNIILLTAGHRSGYKASNNDHQIIKKSHPIVQREMFMPNIIRNLLLTGMRKVVKKQLSEGLMSLSQFYRDYPEAIADYLDMQNEMAGKTSTSEAMENIDLDYHEGTNLYTHVWFGGIAFDKEIPENTHTLLYRDDWGNPELVVVVYLKYGAWGKESAPIGAQMIKKWREIKSHHNK